MTAFWTYIFGDSNPVEIEVGCGTGTFLLEAAARDPTTNWFGIEQSHSRARYVQALITRRDVSNVRVLCADAACVLTALVPANSVQAYHVYFPDPWWKRRHHRRRLFTAAFAHAVQRTLIPGGRAFVSTDVEDVFRLVLETMRTLPALAVHAGHGFPRTTQTRFEEKARARGARIYDGLFVKVAEADNTSSPSPARSAAPTTPAESPS